MNRIKSILLAGFIFSSTFSYSQTNGDVNPPNERNKVSKGYYSIYRNHEKLNRSKSLSGIAPTGVAGEAATDVFPRKGYYSIRNNRNNLNATGVQLNHNPAQGGVRTLQPVVTKGYYSIGTNNRKLPR